MHRGGLTITVILMSIISACSQTTANSPGNYFLGGSTACDEYIRSVLKIPAQLKVDFIRWRLHITEKKNNTGTFALDISYGQGKPNTNGFLEEHEMNAAGNFDISKGVYGNPGLRLFHFHAFNFQSPLLLAEIDQNVFHLADPYKKFLVGNAGWSYSLYKMKE